MRNQAVLLFLSSILWAMPPVNAQDTGAQVAATVGGIEVQLPVPAGFQEASNRSPPMRAAMESLIPTGYRLLTYFVPDAYPEPTASNGFAAPTRYVIVQTHRDIETLSVSAGTMAEVKRMQRSQAEAVFADAAPLVATLTEEMSGKLREQTGRLDLSINVGQLVPLKIFDERPNSISLLAMSKVFLKSDQGTRERLLVAANTTLSLGGKIVYVAVVSSYRDAADLDWVQTQTVQWLASLEALSPPVTSPPG